MLGSVCSYACGPDQYYPYGYKMYRVFDKNSVVKTDERKENCMLWRNLTSPDIPLDDIEKVVYKYTIAQMQELMTVQDPNAFATWIRTNDDREIHEFLTLAKKCEYSRGMMNDPWYYPSKNDGTYMSLIDIVEQVKEYEGTRLKDRYALQAVRAMFSARQYQECIDYWTEIEGSLPDGLIKRMARSYLVGAYSRTGQIDSALEYFTEVGDLNSIIFCLARQGKVTDEVSELECIAQYAPDSPQIPEILQRIVSDFEPRGANERSYEYRMDSTMVKNRHRVLFDKLYKLSRDMSERESSRNKAVWCYTAAFLADLDADPHRAWRYIKQAEQCSSSEYLDESIRVMTMYLDAKVSTYDAAYEKRLYRDLVWLDSKIESNINDNVREAVEQNYIYRSYYTNISFYYWNDVLRRILLAEICPRMMEQGKAVRALQLANVADNLLLNLIDSAEGQSLKDYRCNTDYNYIDYSGDFFSMMLDYVSVDELISYIDRSQSGRTGFDAFLNRRGFVDKDYFYDIAGTRYLKEMDYDEAVRYLSMVSPAYQARLNTESYMNRDPFSIHKTALKNFENYKLRFAAEMCRLEESVANVADNDQKALDMIRYGTGLRNSFTYCWPLTTYRGLWWSRRLYDVPEQVLSKVEAIYEEALGMIDNDELAAIAHIQLCQWKTAVETYPDTYAARYTRMMCDNLCDYSINRVVMASIGW